jgi:hypothetical protein
VKQERSYIIVLKIWERHQIIQILFSRGKQRLYKVAFESSLSLLSP